MTRDELLELVSLGEDSGRQFKADITNADSLAADLVAFSNSSGGLILIGVADEGSATGVATRNSIGRCGVEQRVRRGPHA